MADILTAWDIANASGDWSIDRAPSLNLILDETNASIFDEAGGALCDQPTAFSPGRGLISGGDLQTAVLLSLFSDARADTDDVVPDGTDDPRGWWGDPDLGSKLWLRMRAKRTPQLLPLVVDDVRTALKWLIDDHVVGSIDVSAEWTAASTLGCQVVLHRPDGRAATLKFDWAWQEL